MTDPRSYQLSASENARIFREKIVPNELSHGVPQKNPVAVFVVAQHGSGKTETAGIIQQTIDKRGGSVRLDNDLYKPYHPQHRSLMRQDGEFATAATAADGQQWGKMAAEHARANRYDVLIEETAQNPPYMREQMQQWRDAGYRVETAFMAVPEPVSNLGVLDRYQRQVDATGSGRLPAESKQNASYKGVGDTAKMVDQERLSDTVSVWNRNREAVYLNQRDAKGEWQRQPPAAAEALERERNRQRTPEESADFRRVHRDLSGKLEDRYQPRLEDINRRGQPLLQPERGGGRDPAQSGAAVQGEQRPRELPAGPGPPRQLERGQPKTEPPGRSGKPDAKQPGQQEAKQPEQPRQPDAKQPGQQQQPGQPGAPQRQQPGQPASKPPGQQEQQEQQSPRQPDSKQPEAKQPEGQQPEGQQAEGQQAEGQQAEAKQPPKEQPQQQQQQQPPTQQARQPSGSELASRLDSRTTTPDKAPSKADKPSADPQPGKGVER